MSDSKRSVLYDLFLKYAHKVGDFISGCRLTEQGAGIVFMFASQPIALKPHPA